MKRSVPLCGGALLLVALSTMAPTAASAQTGWWGFDTRRYFDPLRSAVRAPQPSVVVGSAKQVEFSPNDAERLFGWDITMGIDIPLVGWQSSPLSTSGLDEGDFGIGLWLPISFHMIEDVGDSESSRPIINTDYRFGVMLKARYRASEYDAWQARIGLGHESTHLGDEFTLLAFQKDPLNFRRINVSYEPLVYGLGYQRYFDEVMGGGAELTLRHFGEYVLTDGYYSGELSETPGEVTQPTRKFMWGLGGEFVSDMAWRPWVSVEIWSRIEYDYDRPAGRAEDLELSMNLLVGTRVREFDYGAALSFEPYVRYYTGVNPAGQFRNQADWNFFGAGLLIRIGAR